MEDESSAFEQFEWIFVFWYQLPWGENPSHSFLHQNKRVINSIDFKHSEIKSFSLWTALGCDVWSLLQLQMEWIRFGFRIHKIDPVHKWFFCTLMFSFSSFYISLSRAAKCTLLRMVSIYSTKSRHRLEDRNLELSAERHPKRSENSSLNTRQPSDSPTPGGKSIVCLLRGLCFNFSLSLCSCGTAQYGQN